MKKHCLILLLILLTGCSTKFAYKNADWLVYWYVDDYVSLNDAQENLLDEHLKTWLDWHKNSELPAYIAHLKQIKSDIEQGNITPKRIAYHNDKVIAHWHSVRVEIVPDLVALAPNLTEKQINTLFEELAEQEKEKQEKRAKLSDEKRQKRWFTRTENSLENWLGDITSSQNKMVKSLYLAQSPTSHLWSDYRARYQASLKTVLLNIVSESKDQDKLKSLLLNPESFRSDELNKLNNQNRQNYHDFLYGIFLSLTDKQKQHLLSEIDDLINDISELSQ
jgi:hypothetical protein